MCQELRDVLDAPVPSRAGLAQTKPHGARWACSEQTGSYFQAVKKTPPRRQATHYNCVLKKDRARPATGYELS
jgi:hypothetical protein